MPNSANFVFKMCFQVNLRTSDGENHEIDVHLKEVNKGGFGTIHKGACPSLGGTVALKRPSDTGDHVKRVSIIPLCGLAIERRIPILTVDRDSRVKRSCGRASSMKIFCRTMVFAILTTSHTSYRRMSTIPTCFRTLGLTPTRSAKFE